MAEIVEGYIEIFKTRKLFELYAAASLLEEKDVSFYMQETSAEGVRIAMPFQKFMEPGNLYSIFVPEKTVIESKNILSNLPELTGTKPQVWEILSGEKKHFQKKVPGWAFLILLVLGLMMYFVIK
ncbi:MAG: hypothetical protein PVF56_04170 [Desulfobacterales bacterium]|jgi:hypothetical protein